MTKKEVNITLPTDENGLIPRQCPHCDGKFTIHSETFEEQQYLNLRCPYCEWVEDVDEFLTEEQAAYSEAVAETELRRMAEKEFAEMWEDTFSGLSSNDFIEVETNTDEIDFGLRNAPSPHLSIETMQVTCSECSFRYAVRRDENDPSCPVCR